MFAPRDTMPPNYSTVMASQNFYIFMESQSKKKNNTEDKDTVYSSDPDFRIIPSVPAAVLRDMHIAPDDNYTLIYVRSGKISGKISGKNFSIDKPSMIVLRPGEPIEVKNVSDDIDAILCDLNIILIYDISQQIMSNSDIVPSRAPAVVPIPPEDVPHYNRIYETLVPFRGDAQNPHHAYSLMYLILSFFFATGYRAMERISSQPHQDSALVLCNKFFDLLHRYHRRERFLEFYADRLGFSIKHITRTIKRVTGVSAVSWIDAVVMLYAKILVRSTNMSFKEISESMNFSSQSFFGKFFKKYTGMSPKEYRRAGQCAKDNC